jgi:RimJ/RimL family protein N-acetyltransferase
MQIRLLLPSDFARLAAHRARHSRENGRDGDVIFAPQEGERPTDEKDFARELENQHKLVTTPGWQRTWLLSDDKEIYGEITLVNRPPMKATLHHCLLMMGIERSVRGQGWGTKLVHEAVTWAKQQPTLEWIGLYVFENNPAAKALYKKSGFVAGRTTKDMFRVFDQSIDDTEMVLKLR